MKSYTDMIQFVVDKVDQGILRYYEWPAVLTIAEAYGTDTVTVANDIKAEKEIREQARKQARKAEHRRSNDERRLANLARQGE